MFGDMGYTYRHGSLIRRVPMPWKVKPVMSQRKEFVTLAQSEGASMSQLCRRMGISRKTGYK